MTAKDKTKATVKAKAKHLRIHLTLRRHHPHEALVLETLDQLAAGGHVSRTLAARMLLAELPDKVETFVLPNCFQEAVDTRRIPLERVALVMRFYPGKPIDKALGSLLQWMPRDLGMRAEHLRTLLVFAALTRKAKSDPALAGVLARAVARAPSPAPRLPAAAEPTAAPIADSNAVPLKAPARDLLKLFGGEGESLEDVAARMGGTA